MKLCFYELQNDREKNLLMHRFNSKERIMFSKLVTIVKTIPTG